MQSQNSSIFHRNDSISTAISGDDYFISPSQNVSIASTPLEVNAFTPSLASTPAETSTSTSSSQLVAVPKQLTLTLNKRCVIWEANKKDSWDPFWESILLKTDNLNGEQFRKVRWKSNNRSSAWRYFGQGVDVKSGEPKVICNKCQAAYKHPHANGTATSTMQTHATRCQKKGTSAPILSALRAEVRGSEVTVNSNGYQCFRTQMV
jgi:hypothetical protein